MGPFIVPPIIGPSKEHWRSHQDEPLTVKLNAWSRYLVLLTIHGQIFEYSQEMIIVGKICGEESYADTDIDECQGTGLSGSRETDNLPHSREQETRSEVEISAQFHPTIAGQIRERLRGSSNTGRWAIWLQLAATKIRLSGKILQHVVLLRDLHLTVVQHLSLHGPKPIHRFHPVSIKHESLLVISTNHLIYLKN
jgi:hypothetical protein